MRSTVFTFLLLFSLCSAPPVAKSSTDVFNIDDYAPLDHTQSFLKAWEDACSRPGSPIVRVPKGQKILLTPVTLSGPCKSSNIHIQIMGTIVAPSDSNVWGDDAQSLIKIREVDGITIDGSGMIDGRGSAWWSCGKKGHNGCRQVPRVLTIVHSSQVTLRGLNFVNSPNIHVGISDCHDVHISNLSITAPDESPNTDGIHLQRTQQVEITNCKIGTGDDCISIGSGTADVNISRITCGPGHGISIGSLGENNSVANVSNVRVSDSNFKGTLNAARIKTWQGGSGYVNNVTYENLKFTAVHNAIIIDQYYCNGNLNCINQTSALEIRNISFINMHGSSAQRVAIKLACSETVACRDITIEDVELTSTEEGEQLSSYCLNARGVARHQVSPSLPCLKKV